MKYRKEDMPKAMESKDYIMHDVAMGGMNAAYEVYNKELDASPFFKGLPDDRCQSEHWGYVLKGTFKVSYADHEESYAEGDVYYLPAGHVPHVFPGTELIEFSPKEAYAKTMEAVAKNAAAMGMA